jgi:orotate phosphoribosyltransferase
MSKMADDYKELLRPLVKNALVLQATVLASGKTSDFYFDGRLVTLSAAGAYYLAKHVLSTIDPNEYDAVGGMTMGADPIASAISVLSFETNNPKPAFIVRKLVKDHGMKKRVEGPLEDGARVLLVEDVTTSGGSALDAALALKQEKNCEIVRIISLVDREEGAADLFAKEGYLFSPIFTASELK